MNFGNMDIKTFIDYIITFDNIDDILSKCNTQSEAGFIFERLFDVIIKFGFCDVFPRSTYNYLIGNSNTGKLKILNNINDYLNEKVISGNSSGCSDITLQNKTDNTYIFISSKYPKTSNDIKSQKQVSYYDVQHIIAMAVKNKNIYLNYDIYLVVPDKNIVLYKVKNTNKSSKYITDYMHKDNILDKFDLNKYFLLFKKDIIKNYDKDWTDTYMTYKDNLTLYYHQHLIIYKTALLIKDGYRSVLWACKCRSGKTFMVGGFINWQMQSRSCLNVLIITPVPTETTPQFVELFNGFKTFDVFKIHDIKGGKALNNIEFANNNIIVVSKQLLQKYINDKTIFKIKNLNLNLIIFDENHFSGTTDLAKNILSSYSTKNTVKIFLTATYNKPLQEWQIPLEAQIFWDIEDEQICKSLLDDPDNIELLRKKHDNISVDWTLSYLKSEFGLIEDAIFKPYQKMPDMQLITNMFDQERYELLKEKLNSINKIGFCFETLFGLNKSKTRFSFQNEVKTFLRYISGSNKEEDGEKTIFPRIHKICSEYDSRIPFTQIWFLPPNNIDEISCCVKKLMLEDNVLKRYEIMCINRKNKELAKDIKDEIDKKEKEAKNSGKSGLILLAGSMLSLGITLNLCDVVILMHDTLSSDKIMQQMFRCMTEGDDKKFGFVVDMNISRVLNTLINYSICDNSKNITDKIKYIIEHHLINIDIDMMENKNLNTDAMVKKIMDMWKEDPVNNFQMLLRKLDNDYEDFDNETQSLLNNSFVKNIKDNINLEVVLKDEDDEIQELPSGKEYEKEINEKELNEEEFNEEESEQEIKISFTKDVLPYVIPLACILTVKNNNMDFVKMLNDIKENPELLDTFNEQSLIWWNKKDLIDLIKNIVSNYFDKNSNTYNISIQFKMSLQSLLDRPKELLELINDCLKPNKIEKQNFGEVFTPMPIINDMLDKLPKEIWKNSSLKWLDPDTGMGNFQIAIYLRLMEGLKDEIVDTNERKKHILENMLYMCEIGKKNVLICKQIFDINNDYKLNLYEGDTLKFKPFETFKIKQFDVIIGNPPFNSGGIRSHTGKQLGEKNETIWPKFVEKAFEWLKPNGYLVFITPLSWLKNSHSLYNIMLEKHIISLTLWDNSQSKKMINADIPISLYVLRNVLNINKEKTEITSILKRRKTITMANEYLNKNYSIALAYHSIFNKLIHFIETNNLQLEYKTKTVKSIGPKIKLPLNYNLEDMYAIDTFVIKEGIKVKKTLTSHPDANKKKLIIANKSSFTGAFIDDGKLGLTGNHKFYILGDNLELIQKMLKFKIINIIGHYTKYGQDFLDNDALTYLPDIRKLGIKDIDEDKFYEMIGLNEQEIELFNNNTNDLHTMSTNDQLKYMTKTFNGFIKDYEKITNCKSQFKLLR